MWVIIKYVEKMRWRDCERMRYDRAKRRMGEAEGAKMRKEERRVTRFKIEDLRLGNERK